MNEVLAGGMNEVRMKRGSGSGPAFGALHPAGSDETSGDAALLAGCILVLTASFIHPFLQGSWAERLYPGCLFRRLTGLPCLLCGMTRSFAATSHGRLGEAFRHHLLGPPLFFLIILCTLGLCLEMAAGRRLLPRPGEESRRRLCRAGLALLAAAWVARLVLFGTGF